MKVLVRANKESKPFSATNAHFNKILPNGRVTSGTVSLWKLWDSDFLRKGNYTAAIEDVTPSRTFLVVDVPDTPITIEQLLNLYPELLL
jgi:hypothetical protein